MTVCVHSINCKMVDLLLGCEVLEGEDEAPVEVPLPGEGAVVHVRRLGILRTLQPPVHTNNNQQYPTVQ